jgi:hypothetical protein
MDDLVEDVIISRDVIFDNDLTIVFGALFSRSVAIERGESKDEMVVDDTESVSDDEIIICNNISEVNREPIRPLLKIANDVDDVEDEFGDFEAFPVYEGIVDVSLFNVKDEGLAGSRIKMLLMEFKGIFSAQASKEPMQGEKFNTKVNDSEWFVDSNRLPPRIQSYKKEIELIDQLEKLLNLGVIKPSSARAWSQVHLVPKGEGYRLCLDFRNLNAVSDKHNWPIPRIDDILFRLGSRKAKYWSKLDLTAGYHQCEIDEKFRKYTAFMTFKGLYEWCRLPMGLKGAGHFFQQLVAGIVLAGLLYSICEAYFDDIIVSGQSEEEHLLNLRKVLERLRDNRVTLNPKKCIFGASEIEFCGHLLRENGSHFSEEKLKDLEVIPDPKSKGGLKSFMGLANYFRPHVKDYAQYEVEINRLMPGYKKKHRSHVVKWTEVAKAAFADLRKAILDCPMLFFIDEKLPIYLNTDASDFAIGGYLYQVGVEAKELPVRFLSKSLVGCQYRWSTFEKEGYAMYFSIMTFKYLLDGRRFIVRTDHLNILKLNVDASAKVMRWKISLCPFDFTIEHVLGPRNVVADYMSRVEELMAKMKINRSEAFVEYVNMTVSEEEKEDIIALAHNDSVGHSGVERTMKVLESLKYKWKGMRKDVERFVASCPSCQLLGSRISNLSGESFWINPSGPMDIISIDHIGPMNSANDGEGRGGHILVIIDCFSKWTSLYHVKDTSAKAAVQCFNKFIAMFGEPVHVMSDNGPAFSSNLWNEYLKYIDVKARKTTPYSHQENGIVERANKEVLRHLRAMLLNSPIVAVNEWHDYLPFVERIMNDHKHSATGYSPRELLFGKSSFDDKREYSKPRTHFSNVEVVNDQRNNRFENFNGEYYFNESNNESRLDYLDNLNIKRKEILDKAKAYFRSQGEIKMNKGSKGDSLEIGDYVLLSKPESLINSNKLDPPKEGPFRVIGRDGSNYLINDDVYNKEYKVHISRLTRFVNRGNNARDVALRRNKSFDVQEILQHRGGNISVKSINSIYFLVKWLGYNSEHNTWESFATLKYNVELHKYLRKLGHLNCIPKRFRELRDP